MPRARCADIFAGYNAAVIVVGAAGAGKSYTMYGGMGEDGAGLAPRCIRYACPPPPRPRRGTRDLMPEGGHPRGSAIFEERENRVMNDRTCASIIIA